MKNLLVVFRKAMVDKGFVNWEKDGPTYKMANTDKQKTPIAIP